MVYGKTQAPHNTAIIKKCRKKDTGLCCHNHLAINLQSEKSILMKLLKPIRKQAFKMSDKKRQSPARLTPVCVRLFFSHTNGAIMERIAWVDNCKLLQTCRLFVLFCHILSEP